MAELVEAAAVEVAVGGEAVDAGFGLGHRALVNDEHATTGPGGGHVEGAAVFAILVVGVPGSVFVGAEAMHLPATRHGDGGPDSGLASARHAEIPRDGVVLVGAGEVEAFGPGTLRKREERRQQSQDKRRVEQASDLSEAGRAGRRHRGPPDMWPQKRSQGMRP